MPLPELLPERYGDFNIPPINAINDNRDAVELSVVIPVYNEADNIGPLLAEITREFKQAHIVSYELIVVDDDSSDNSWRIALQSAAHDARIRVLRRTAERGLSSAAIRGWQAARGGYLALIDGDRQHPPRLLVDLFEKICGTEQDRIDIAIGSRRADGGSVGEWSLFRNILSLGARAVGRMVFPRLLKNISDTMSGCFIVRRQILEGAPLRPRGFKILLEIIGSIHRLTTAEVGYRFMVRQAGESKATVGQGIAYMRQLVHLRFYRWRQALRGWIITDIKA